MGVDGSAVYRPLRFASRKRTFFRTARLSEAGAHGQPGAGNVGRTDGVVFQHAQGRAGADAVECVEEAGHGHRQEPDGDDAGLG